MTAKPQAVTTPDRRAHPRSPIVVREARCICGMDVFFGYARDISRSGLFISTPKRRMPGEVHEIQFTLPELQRTFRCRARVVWSRGYDPEVSTRLPGFGLQFLDLPEEDARLIDQWVQTVQSD